MARESQAEMKLTGLTHEPQSRIKEWLQVIFAVILLAWLATTLVVLVFKRDPYSSFRSCIQKYEGAASARDTLRVDAEFPVGTVTPASNTCGMLRRDGTLARYEASVENR